MRPANLLIITSDQHCPRILGAAGDRAVRTPALDAMAGHGVRFASAFCNSPICVPARAVLATGRYAHATGNWDNASPYTGSEAPSWGHHLAARGHRVTTIGKLHYRNTTDDTGFDDQIVPMHVRNGIGDLYPLLRGDAPPTETTRRQVLDAGAGDSEYLRYDKEITRQSLQWLEQQPQGRPWVLSVNYVSPHFPLTAPPEFHDLYRSQDIPLPAQALPAQWPDHPAITSLRRLMSHDQPFDETSIRRARHAYYALVSFLDAQIGELLSALERTGSAETTRVIYLSDHGDMVGAHGLWFKHAMYTESVGIPLILRPLPGDGLPPSTVATNVSQVDLYPTIVHAVTGTPPPSDPARPGESLWRIAGDPPARRTVFSEYHAMYSPGASYLVHDGRYKYIHYLGFPSQLFDTETDPDETVDLAADPAHADIRARLHTALLDIIDPEAADAACKRDAQRKIDAGGGRDAVRSGGMTVSFTRTPVEFSLPGRQEYGLAGERAAGPPVAGQ